MLFDELHRGTLSAKNRLVRAATFTGLSDADGHLTPELTAVYEELAAGGVGTIITEFASITPDGHPYAHMAGMHDDSFIEGYRQLTDAVHRHGTAMVLQLAHGGSAARTPAEGERVLGPSPMANPKTGVVPEEASVPELHALAKAFAAAAVRAQQAGFDGVELHAAHGYLLSQFLNPLLNRRTDEYGGSPENRTRFVAECVTAVRRSVTSSFPVLVKLNSSDRVDGGLTEDESLAVALRLLECGATAIEVSGAWRTFSAADTNGTPYFAGFASRLASATDAPVILTGGCRSTEIMEHLAAEAGIAAFGLCRPLICQPDLPNIWQDDPSVMPRCISCNGCSGAPGSRCILPAAQH